MRRVWILAGFAVAAVWLAPCSRDRKPAAPPPPTRGIILISLDALRADHLGAYGYGRDTSPFLDSLAARGVVFENAFAQYPSTLASHLSMFTGFYPQEHGVYRPETVLAEEIETLPERLSSRGIATAGFTEGGFMAGGYGFARGFDQFLATPHRADTDVEATLDRGLAFLEQLAADERFFLFLHTYTIHDPYDPPPPFDRMFWPGEPPAGAFPSTGPNLRRVNRGELAVTPEIVDWFAARYDGSIRYVDEVLARFWARIEELGLADETTLVITSDHGESFYEHGKLAHIQVYPEQLQVPLIVVHPEAETGARVTAPVELVDLAPTLHELAGVDSPAGLSGDSLAGYLTDPGTARGEEAYGETLDRDTMKTLFRVQDGTLYQIILFEPEADPGGAWVSRAVRFHAATAELELEAQSFHRPRTMRVLHDGTEIAAIELDTSWRAIAIELPEAAVGREVVLATRECDSPLTLGVGQDARCLSFQVRGLKLRRTELYDLDADPLAQENLARERHDLHRLLLRKLTQRQFTPVAAGRTQELSEETLETLRALGYIR